MKRIIIAIAGLTGSGLGQSAIPGAVIGAGYSLPIPVAVAPGQIITFFVHGIGAALKDPVVASSLPLPTSLAGISATFLQGSPIPVPIVGVEPVSDLCEVPLMPGCASSYAAVTVQIPLNIIAQNPLAIVGNLPPTGQIDFSENGALRASLVVVPYVDQIHVLRTNVWPLNLAPGGGVDPPSGAPAVTHADGRRVTTSNPARSGETVAIYAVGLGYTESFSFTTSGDAPKAPVPTLLTFRVSFDPRPNALASRPSKPGENGPSTVAPDFVGLVPWAWTR